jgi:hypothetical protein
MNVCVLNDTMMTQLLPCAKSVTQPAKLVLMEPLRVVKLADLTQIGKLILIMNASALLAISRLQLSLVMLVTTPAQLAHQNQKPRV